MVGYFRTSDSRMCCDGFVNSRSVKLFLFILVVLVDGLTATGNVKEINKGNLNEFLKEKLFVLTFVTSTSCARCHNLYPYFAAASQGFSRDTEIFFTRTYDKKLIQEWDISELPALVYHKKGPDDNDAFGKREIIDVDITVDDITSAIEGVLHGDFDNIKKKYSICLNEDNFNEMVTTPTQSVMVLIYDSDKSDVHSTEVMEEYAAVSAAYRKDDGILFTTLNVNKHKQLRDEKFKTRDVPAVMWLGEKDNKATMRFGGMLHKELIVRFVNERTGLNRMSTGALMEEAGRIPAVDQLLEEHADLVASADEDSLALLSHAIMEKKKDLKQNHDIEMLHYYIQVLDEMSKEKESSPVLDDLVMNLEGTLYSEYEPSTRTAELLKRQMNILRFFEKTIRFFRSGEWAKTAAKGDHAEFKDTIRHEHVHTEL